MKKIIFLLLIFALYNCQSNASTLSNEINIYNLKSKNMYMLDLDTSAEKIKISDKSILNIFPITTIENDKKQLFIEAENDGVCDVIITSNNKDYKLRFITGPFFQDNKDNLTLIDIPEVIKEEKK